MSVPKEYYVIGGLIGLGIDVLLEVLLQMINLKDTQQLLVVCRKTFQLQLHYRFPSIIKYLRDVKYSIPAPFLQDVELEKNKFTHILYGNSVILFDPVINSRIVKFEVLNVKDLDTVGISDESVHFSRNQSPSSAGKNNTIQYFRDGQISHNENWVEGNVKFSSGDRIALELNMDSNPRELTFFVNDIEQNNYIVNIPSAVRFWAFFWNKQQSFEILKFEYQLFSCAKHGDKSLSFEWGKEWKLHRLPKVVQNELDDTITEMEEILINMKQE
ncbi:MAG: hypothetical protein EZS28_026980 [Streblomastix strix]|uniref:Uncharacterized protein n=1 Tax=Streblomastix strix TaxID=222440 RepID=A0A5J4V564_9EUKA|nr:MAG: hypothetical protein EZS28_026980 [Streblomastix strix]